MATQVEQILAAAAVAGTVALAVVEGGQAVLDRDALAQLGAPLGRLRARAQLHEEGFVRVDGQTAPALALCARALRLPRARGAGRRREVDRVAEGEGPHDVVRAAHGAGFEVDGELALGEEGAVAQRKGFAADAHAELAMRFDALVAEVTTVVEQLWCSDALRLIGRRDRDGAHQPGRVEIDRDVALVAVDALLLGLATVAHVGVADADASILSDALGDAPPAAVRIGLGVLRDELLDELPLLLEWRRAEVFRELLLQPVPE